MFPEIIYYIVNYTTHEKLFFSKLEHVKSYEKYVDKTNDYIIYQAKTNTWQLIGGQIHFDTKEKTPKSFFESESFE